jgi:hypothetical protein
MYPRRDRLALLLRSHRVLGTCRDLNTGRATIILLRCPPEVQRALQNRLAEGGESNRLLLAHPMLIHAFIAEHLVTQGLEFSRDFAAPMYGLVGTSQSYGLRHFCLTRGHRSLTLDAWPANILSELSDSCSWLVKWEMS